MRKVKLDQLVTEGVNQNTIDIDQRNAFEIVSLMNREDQLVALLWSKSSDNKQLYRGTR